MAYNLHYSDYPPWAAPVVEPLGGVTVPGGPSFGGPKPPDVTLPVPSFAITVPYGRTSPLHIPRHDLVLSGADSLLLRVTIVDSDSATAQAIELTGGIGGPSLQMFVWPDTYYRTSWDYGAQPYCCPPTPIWSGAGVISDAAGAFDITFPSGTMMCWPRRCGWCVQLATTIRMPSFSCQARSTFAVWEAHIRW